MKENLICASVPHGSAEYDAAVALRRTVLMGPLGLTVPPETVAAEKSDYPLVCSTPQGEVVACMILTPESDSSIRMRQVAVTFQRQGEGIGRKLVEFSEEFARERGFALMTLHARQGAIPFYEHIGYECYDEPFEEVTIPHRKMRKKLRENYE